MHGLWHKTEPYGNLGPTRPTPTKHETRLNEAVVNRPDFCGG